MISPFAVGLFNLHLVLKIKLKNCLTIEIMAIFIAKLSNTDFILLVYY